MATPTELERRVRQAYERARLRSGLLTGLSLAAVTLLAQSMAWFQWGVFVCAMVASVIVGAARYRGQIFGAAAEAGVWAALVPVAMVFGVRGGMGHVCTSQICWSLCLVACMVGGVFSAVIVAWRAAQWAASPLYWATASAVVFLLASLACSCAGVLATILVVASYAASMIPVRLLLRSC